MPRGDVGVPPLFGRKKEKSTVQQIRRLQLTRSLTHSLTHYADGIGRGAPAETPVELNY